MMAAAPASTVGTITETTQLPEGSPVVKLKLKKPSKGKRVNWTSETVDNEHMGRKKSKCCCIYETPRLFGESSDEGDDDDDCANCHGHKKKCYKQGPDEPGSSKPPDNPQPTE